MSVIYVICVININNLKTHKDYWDQNNKRCSNPRLDLGLVINEVYYFSEL